MNIRTLACMFLSLVLVNGVAAQTSGGGSTLPLNVHLAVGDLDGNGLIDVVVSRHSENTVEVWEAIDESNFALVFSLSVANPAGIAIGDYDGDGILDIAIGNDISNSVSIALGLGGFDFAIGVVIPVDIRPDIVFSLDVCEDGVSEIGVTDLKKTVAKIIESPVWNPQVKTITQDTPTPNCTESSYGNPCNNYTEPDCDPNSGAGIQECLRASQCRYLKCIWAACVLLHGGGYYITWYWNMEACVAVWGAESGGCVPSYILHGA